MPQDFCQPRISGSVAYFQGAIVLPILRFEGRFVKLSASLGSISFQVVQLFGIPSSVHTLDPSTIPIFRQA